MLPPIKPGVFLRPCLTLYFDGASESERWTKKAAQRLELLLVLDVEKTARNPK